VEVTEVAVVMEGVAVSEVVMAEVRVQLYSH